MNEEELARLKARMEAHEFLMREMYIARMPPAQLEGFMQTALEKYKPPAQPESEQAKLERERVASCLREFGEAVEHGMRVRMAEAEKASYSGGPIQ